MSTYAARGEDGRVHAVYDQTEVYVLHRGNEDVAVCGAAEVWFTIDSNTTVTCLWCIATMYSGTWVDIHSDPIESDSLVRYLRKKR
jgi:hypothetical protein